MSRNADSGFRAVSRARKPFTAERAGGDLTSAPMEMTPVHQQAPIAMGVNGADGRDGPAPHPWGIRRIRFEIPVAKGNKSPTARVPTLVGKGIPPFPAWRPSKKR